MSVRPYIHTYAADYGFEERSAIMQHIATSPFITSHTQVEQFEKDFSKRHGRSHGHMVNSGSSALLVAITAMGWKPGDKILTSAVAFPTSISPLLLFGLQPVFVDVQEGTYNIDYAKLYETIQKVECAGAVLPHMLGNPLDPRCFSHFDKTVEDACDALGSKIDGKPCGTFGSVSCFSFFPAHHICTGEGGMVLTNNHQTSDLLRKLISWGRQCYCRPGFDNSCGKRFDHDIDGIEYDHKYIFDTAGYNLKPLELSGILGLVQLKKADKYREIRKYNFNYLLTEFQDVQDNVVLPRRLDGAVPSWFGFPLTLKKGDRRDICKRIEARGVQTRMVMGGNITRQPIFKGREVIAPLGLTESDRVMEMAFVIPANHTVTEQEVEHIGAVVKEEVVR